MNIHFSLYRNRILRKPDAIQRRLKRREENEEGDSYGHHYGGCNYRLSRSPDGRVALRAHRHGAEGHVCRVNRIGAALHPLSAGGYLRHAYGFQGHAPQP